MGGRFDPQSPDLFCIRAGKRTCVFASEGAECASKGAEYAIVGKSVFSDALDKYRNISFLFNRTEEAKYIHI